MTRTNSSYESFDCKGGAIMLDGMYDLNVDMPLGKKKGKVSITTQGDDVVLDLEAPLIGKQSITGKLQPPNGFTAGGSMRVKLVGKVDYTAEGKVEGDQLTGVIHSSKGDLTITGTRL